MLHTDTRIPVILNFLSFKKQIWLIIFVKKRRADKEFEIGDGY